MNLLNVIRGESFWTPARRLFAGQSPGRGKGRLPGGHVGDREDLKKALLFCQGCVRKFNHIRAGYTKKRNLPVVRGRCDGCQEYTPQGHLMVHHTLANLC